MSPDSKLASGMNERGTTYVNVVRPGMTTHESSLRRFAGARTMRYPRATLVRLTTKPNVVLARLGVAFRCRPLGRTSESTRSVEDDS